MFDLDSTQKSNHLAVTKRSRLELSFEVDPTGRTYVGKQFSSYPFHVCRPFYMDSDSCEGMATVYTQSCSGGLYTQDKLTTVVGAGKNAQVHLTTQASTIVHQGTRGPACQSVELRADDGTLLEYTPDPMILFPKSKLKSDVTVRLAQGATAILFDSFLAHDYRGGTDVFEYFENNVTLTDLVGTPLAVDRFRISGADYANSHVGRMGQFTCHGTVMVVASNIDLDGLISDARQCSANIDDGICGVSELPNQNGFSARILTRDAVSMNKAMGELWAISRSAITGKRPTYRRK